MGTGQGRNRDRAGMGWKGDENREEKGRGKDRMALV